PRAVTCEKPETVGPLLHVAQTGGRLPQHVTALTHGKDAVWLGTAHLGCARIEGLSQRPYRQNDLIPAVTGRLYAVTDGSSTLLATRQPWLWRYDGQSFVREVVDPQT